MLRICIRIRLLPMWVTPNARDTCEAKRCQFCDNNNNSVITGLISLKLHMLGNTHLAMYFHVLQLGCRATALAHVQGSFPNLENG